MTDEDEQSGNREIAVKEPSESRTPHKWWQWFLLYPTVAVALLGALPTISELYKSTKLGVGYGESNQALVQQKLWEKNMTCTAAPFDWLITPSNAKVDATICKSGDVLVRVESPENYSRYQWVAVDELLAVKTASINFVASAVAAEYPNGLIVAQNGFRPICQRWLDRVMLLRRIEVPGRGCFDEVVNTYNGMVVSSVPAPCNPSC